MTLRPSARAGSRGHRRRPYDRPVQVALAASVALLAGMAVGALAAFGLAGRRAGGPPAPAATPPVAGPVSRPDVAWQVLDVMHQGALVLDADDGVVLANPAAE